MTVISQPKPGQKTGEAKSSVQAKPASITPPVYKPAQPSARIQTKGVAPSARPISTAPPVYQPSQTGAKIQSKAPAPVQRPGAVALPSGLPHKAKVAQPSTGAGVMRPASVAARPVVPRVSSSLQADFIGRPRFNPASGSSAQQKKGGAARILQPKLGPGVEAFEVNLQQRSGGWTLPKEIQGKLEKAMGADFSDVRVHVGSEVSAIGAIAFTWGSNIHFAPGYYSPHTPHGQQLLAHELTHVLQQRSGRVHNPFGNGVAVVQDQALEAEADRLGQKAAMAMFHEG